MQKSRSRYSSTREVAVGAAGEVDAVYAIGTAVVEVGNADTELTQYVQCVRKIDAVYEYSVGRVDAEFTP